MVTYAAALMSAALGAVHGLSFIASFNGSPPPGLNDYRASDEPAFDGPGSPVVLFIVDGLRLDGVALLGLEPERLETARFCELHAEYPSFSKTGYVALLSGATPMISGVQTNAFRGQLHVEHIPGWAHRRSVPTHIVTDGLDWWDPLFEGDWHSRHFDAEDFDEALSKALERVRSWGEAPGLLVVHMVQGDEAGHDHGTQSPEYIAAMAHIGRRLIRTLEALDGAATVFMVSDHGHLRRGGHGGAEPEVIRTPMLAWGSRNRPSPGGCQGRLVDIASTVSGILGLPPGAANTGRPLPGFVGTEFRRRVDVQQHRLSTLVGERLARPDGDVLSAVRPPTLLGTFLASVGMSILVVVGFRVLFSAGPSWQQLAAVAILPISFACTYAAVEPSLSFSAVWVQAEWVLRMGLIYIVAWAFGEGLIMGLGLRVRAGTWSVEAEVFLRLGAALVLHASALGWHGAWSGGPELGHPTAAFVLVIADTLLVATGLDGLVRLAWRDLTEGRSSTLA